MGIKHSVAGLLGVVFAVAVIEAAKADELRCMNTTTKEEIHNTTNQDESRLFIFKTIDGRYFVFDLTRCRIILDK